ncbi:MAG: hypothetical protein KGM91_00790 [Burkholderiales bacterium]|nr:hypothetical protein [Burkholderiales bacterium]
MNLSFPKRPAGSGLRRSAARLVVLGAGLFTALAASALDYGPFSLVGFAKYDATLSNNACPNCQLYPGASKDEPWGDTLVPGAPYGRQTASIEQEQLWAGAHFDLGHGFELDGLMSQRWQFGKAAFPGFLFERNVSVHHEEYGSLEIGAMTTRGWSLADYPFGTEIGLSYAWGSSGAGYGLLTGALRYTSRVFDVAGGDLVLEATYDRGNTAFKIHKPSFSEYWLQYHHGDLQFDGIVQNTRNGTPLAFAQSPFTGLTPFPADDAKLGGSGQSIVMAMARWRVTTPLQLYAGLRRNRWSGAYAVITQYQASGSIWNDMFNVCWNSDVASCANNPGYAATSTDWIVGGRYTTGPWSFYSGMMMLGKASTANPSPRAQSSANNWALLNTLGAEYDFGHGFKVSATAATIHFGQIGRSPMSMAANSQFVAADSRVTRNGNSLTLEAVFAF